MKIEPMKILRNDNYFIIIIIIHISRILYQDVVRKVMMMHLDLKYTSLCTNYAIQAFSIVKDLHVYYAVIGGKKNNITDFKTISLIWHYLFMEKKEKILFFFFEFFSHSLFNNFVKKANLKASNFNKNKLKFIQAFAMMLNVNRYTRERKCSHNYHVEIRMYAVNPLILLDTIFTVSDAAA